MHHLIATVESLASDGDYYDKLLAGRIAWLWWCVGRGDRWVAAQQRALRADAKRAAERQFIEALDRGDEPAWTARRVRESTLLTHAARTAAKYERGISSEIVRLGKELRQRRLARSRTPH